MSGTETGSLTGIQKRFAQLEQCWTWADVVREAILTPADKYDSNHTKNKAAAY
jgi:hypothetical protein